MLLMTNTKNDATRLWDGATNTDSATAERVMLREYIRIAGVSFTPAAAQNIEETGIDAGEIQRDVRSIANGDSSEYALLGRCLVGADADRVGGWHDYVSAIAAAELVEHNGEVVDNENGTSR